MQTKKIAIIHPNEQFLHIVGVMNQRLENQRLGYDTVPMLIKGTTTPKDVASFVDESKPDLVLLAEDFPHLSGREKSIEALVEIRKNDPNTLIFMILALIIENALAKLIVISALILSLIYFLIKLRSIKLDMEQEKGDNP